MDLSVHPGVALGVGMGASKTGVPSHPILGHGLSSYCIDDFLQLLFFFVNESGHFGITSFL
jgi:hypothetical protein